MAAKAVPSGLWRPIYSRNRSAPHQLCRHVSSRRTLVSLSTSRTRYPNNYDVVAYGKPQSRNPRRHASTDTAGDARSLGTRTKNLLLGTALGIFLTAGYFYVTDTRAGFHRWVVVPLLRFAYPDGEDAHIFGNRALKMLHSFGVHIRERGDPDSAGDLRTEIFGFILANPIALSGGIDKNADIPTPLLELGPSIVEVGGATPYPQAGNPKPRVFRVPSQEALINRYGLNSEGADFIAMRLRQRVREFAYSMGLGMDEAAERAVLDGVAGVPPGSLTKSKLLAVQVAKNKFTPDNDIEAVKRDYVYCTDMLAKYSDIITVNVSSPNTPKLRGLQRVGPLTQILSAVVEAAQKIDRRTKPPVMVKVSPDEDSDEDILGVCDAVWRSGAAGVIVGNTTVHRPDVFPGSKPLTAREEAAMAEVGGFSGPHLFERTLALVKRYRYFLDEGLKHKSEANGEAKEVSKVIFATGGIANGKQALEVLQAGASVAMVYTAMVYGGAGTVSRLKQEMREEMKAQLEAPGAR